MAVSKLSQIAAASNPPALTDTLIGPASPVDLKYTLSQVGSTLAGQVTYITAPSGLTFYVSLSGSDSNPGTVGSPFRTVQHATSVAGTYDYQGQFFPTINVAAGTFTESGASGSGVTPPPLFRIPPSSHGVIIGAGVSSTTIFSSNQCVNLSGLNCNWQFQEMTLDSKGTFQTNNLALLRLTGNVTCIDSSNSGFFSPFHIQNGSLCGINACTLSIPNGFQFNFLLSEGFEVYSVASFSTIVFPSTTFGTAGTDYWLVADMGGGEAQSGYYEFRHMTLTNVAKFTGSQVGIFDASDFFLWTDNGLLSDFPGVSSGNTVNNFALIWNGSRPVARMLSQPAGPFSSANNATGVQRDSLQLGKDATNGQRYIAYNDGGTVYAIQVGRFVNTQSGASYTMALTDQDGRVEMSSATANTFTVPQDSVFSPAAPPVGCEVRVTRTGAGVTTIAAGTGATVNNAGNIATQWTSALLYKTAANTWNQTTV